MFCEAAQAPRSPASPSAQHQLKASPRDPWSTGTEEELPTDFHEVLRQEHKVTRTAIAGLQSNVDKILTITERTFKALGEISLSAAHPRPESCHSSDDAHTLPLNSQNEGQWFQASGEIEMEGVRSSNGGWQEKGRLMRHANSSANSSSLPHVISTGSRQDNVTATWVNFLEGLPTQMLPEMSRALSPPSARHMKLDQETTGSSGNYTAARGGRPGTKGATWGSKRGECEEPLDENFAYIANINEDGEQFSESPADVDPAPPGRWSYRIQGTVQNIQQKLNMVKALERAKGWGAGHGYESERSRHLRTNNTWVSHEKFTAASCTLILLYTIFIGISVEVGVRSRREPGGIRPEWLKWCDFSFTVLFVIEIFARGLLYGRLFFTGGDYLWNLFDIVLVMSQVVDFLFTFWNISFLRIFRVLRVVKVARVLRTVKYFTELRLMVMSIISCMSSLLWAFLLLVLVLYLTAIGILQVVEYELGDVQNYEVLPSKLFNYYGSVAGSMLTLFMSISGGADWEDLMQPLTYFSRGYALIYVMYVSFVVFGIMNVLTAIFVESGSQIAAVDQDLAIQEQLRRDKSTINTIRNMFYEADADGSGALTEQELEELLVNPKYIWAMRLVGVDVSEARGLFQLLDMSGTNQVNIDEFISGIMRLKGSAKGVDLATLIYENKRMYQALHASLEGMSDRITMLDQRLPPKGYKTSRRDGSKESRAAAGQLGPLSPAGHLGLLSPAMSRRPPEQQHHLSL
mmetsp:Transcript_67044/g.160691  ORF Transcript_67044/g.160691 Transcript_67044/m.160691 type:complete len:745 (+) Transcript_67044:127-2361(+)